MVASAHAEIIVYGYDILRSLPTERLHDFPADDWCLAQKAEGRRQKAEGRRQKAEGRRQKVTA